MQYRAGGIAATVLVTFCLIAVRSSAAACPASRGQSVVLASQELDPDVFLWDSGDRLIRYAQGDYSVNIVLKHTALVRAYSRATVIKCKNESIRPSFAGRMDPAVDLIGVRVTTGASKGRYGWVLSTDVRRADGSPLTNKGHT